MDTPMSHSELEELAAGYVLGALEPDDEHAFQRHLEGCPTCQATVRELEAVVGELAYSAPPADPPDTVWAGIRRQIKPEAARRGAVGGPAGTAAGQGGPGRSGPETAPGGRPGTAGAGRRLRLLPGLAAAAAILLVVVLSLWNLNLRDENAVQRDRIAALEQATQLANDPTANLVALNGSDAAPPGAQATVIASTREDRGVLLIENLPPLQRDRVYELWGIPAGGTTADAQKAVVFVPLRRQGTQTVQFEVPVQPGTTFAITEEPAPDGSGKPTSEPLLAGSAATA